MQLSVVLTDKLGSVFIVSCFKLEEYEWKEPYNRLSLSFLTLGPERFKCPAVD